MADGNILQLAIWYIINETHNVVFIKNKKSIKLKMCRQHYN